MKHCWTWIMMLLPFVAFSQSSGQIKTAKAVIKALESGNTDKIMAYFPEDVQQKIKASDLRQSIERAKYFIGNNDFPPDAEIIINERTLMSDKGPDKATVLIFPFPVPPPGQQVKQTIEITFLLSLGNKQIRNLAVTDYTKIVATKPETNFIKRFNFTPEKVSQFEIYYERGQSFAGVRDSTLFFVVNGKKNKMDSIRLDTILPTLFKTLNAAEIASRKTIEGRLGYQGTPEFVFFEFRLANDHRKYRLEMILNKDNKAAEPLAEMIMLKVKDYPYDDAVYFMDKEKNQRLYQLLRNMAAADYGTSYSNYR